MQDLPLQLDRMANPCDRAEKILEKSVGQMIHTAHNHKASADLKKSLILCGALRFAFDQWIFPGIFLCTVTWICRPVKLQGKGLGIIFSPLPFTSYYDRCWMSDV